MALIDNKITTPITTIQSLSRKPTPSEVLTYQQLQAKFDEAPEVLRLKLNALIDNLLSTTSGNSGSENIGSRAITGITGNTVYAQIASLLNIAQAAQAGTILPGTISDEMLSNSDGQIKDRLTDFETSVYTSLLDKVSQSAYTKLIPYAITTGSANAYAITLSPVPTSYSDGMAVTVKINIANTGASTININGLGVKSILKQNGNAVASGNLKANTPYTLRYNGTAFILQGEGGEYGTAIASDVLAPATIGTDTGIVTGTMVNRGTFNLAFGASVPAGYYSGGTVPSGYKNLTGQASGNNTSSFTVTGLGFTPVYIFIHGSWTDYNTGTANPILIYRNGIGIENFMNSGSLQPTFSVSNGTFTVTRNTSGGIFSSASTYYWYAFGS